MPVKAKGKITRKKHRYHQRRGGNTRRCSNHKIMFEPDEFKKHDCEGLEDSRGLTSSIFCQSGTLPSETAAR
eukprot:6214653-Pleurochrysis_carterae.AAC.2